MQHQKFAVCSAVVVVGLLTVGAARVARAEGDPHLGMWKQNFAKSTFTPARTGPAPQSVTRKYEVFEGNGFKYRAETVSADGKRETVTYSAHLDGKEVPHVGAANADTIALKRIDASSFDVTLKKAGKVVLAGTNVVSKDGKTLTVTAKGTNAQGQPISMMLVFEKQ